MKYCKGCGSALKEDMDFCPNCGVKIIHSSLETVEQPRKFYRSTHDRMIAGVCGGLAKYFNIDPVLVRIGFVLAFFMGGMSFYAYLLIWLLTSEEPRAGS